MCPSAPPATQCEPQQQTTRTPVNHASPATSTMDDLPPSSSSSVSSHSSNATMDHLSPSPSIVKHRLQQQQQQEEQQQELILSDGCSKKRKSSHRNLASSTTDIDTATTQNTTTTSKKKAKIKAVTYMTLCTAIHFAGYEFARSATLSMFTSSDLGFENKAVLSLGVACVSPFSVFLLWSFTKTLKRYGPKHALLQSTLTCTFIMAFAAIILYHIQPTDTTISDPQLHKYTSTSSSSSSTNGTTDNDVKIITNDNNDRLYNTTISTHIISRVVLFILFIFQSANVQLLYTQHWSFIGSVLTPEEGKVWFAPIAGVGSFTSTVAAANISILVERMGLIHMLLSASLIIGSSAIFGNAAYTIAAKYGFEPSKSDKKSKDSTKNKLGSTSDHSSSNEQNLNRTTNESTPCTSSSSSSSSEGILKTAVVLFRRVPVLGALFCEVMLSQCLSSLLNFLFLIKAKSTILDDKARAGWTGKRYAWINGTSGVLQFFVIPIVTKKVHARFLWIFMPVTMIILTILQSCEDNVSLMFVGTSFATMKTLEYSVRGVTSEMLYVSLDYESRFVGKEIINLLASRLGKSGTALCLSLISSFWRKEEGGLEYFVSLGSILVAFMWLVSAFRLTRLLPSTTNTKEN